MRLGQIGNDVPPAIVGHDAPVEPGGQFGGFRDHPNTGFGTFLARDDAADIVGVNCDGCGWRLTRACRIKRRE